MVEWFQALTTLQQVYLVFALLGTFLFLIQLVLMVVGGDGDMDGGDVGLDGQVDTDMSHDTDASFKLLSYQGLTAFFMMFGLTGMALNRGSGYSGFISTVVSLGVGAAAMYGVAKLFGFFKSMHSSGTINIYNAIGQKGRVYLTIQEETPGQIEVAIQGHLKIYDAISEDKTKIPTDMQVQVVGVISNKTMVVKRI